MRFCEWRAVNTFNRKLNVDNRHSGYINALTYFKRITERNHNGYDTVDPQSLTECTQQKFLIPLLMHQMKICHTSYDSIIPKHICVLMANYCDNKEIIDLSSVKTDIKYMTQELQTILFHKIATNTQETVEYEIHNRNMKTIFPRLAQYEHYSGHSVQLQSILSAESCFESISNEVQNVKHEQHTQTMKQLSDELRVLKKLIEINQSCPHYIKYYRTHIFTRLEPLLQLNTATFESIVNKYHSSVEDITTLNAGSGKWRLTLGGDFAKLVNYLQHKSRNATENTDNEGKDDQNVVELINFQLNKLKETWAKRVVQSLLTQPSDSILNKPMPVINEVSQGNGSIVIDYVLTGFDAQTIDLCTPVSIDNVKYGIVSHVLLPVEESVNKPIKIQCCKKLCDIHQWSAEIYNTIVDNPEYRRYIEMYNLDSSLHKILKISVFL